MASISTFRDLIVWQKGHSLVILIYNLTSKFPKSEQFGLTSQIRRASISITSNIAEGFSLSSIKEKIQFYYIARGSLSEVENQVEIAKDVGYLAQKDYKELLNVMDEIGRLMNGLLNKTKLREQR